MARDFTQERLRVETRDSEVQLWSEAQANGATHRYCIAVVNGLPSIGTIVDAGLIAARWNACPDAFEKLVDAVEDEDWISVRDAAVILRRAIYGEG